MKIPVLSTGGWQTASRVRAAIASGAFDGVAIARSLVANPDLIAVVEAGPRPAREALHLLQPLPRSTRRRTRWAATSRCAFPSRDAMVEQLMTIYRAKPELRDARGRGGLTVLREAPVTAVQEALRRRRRLLSPLYALVAAHPPARADRGRGRRLRRSGGWPRIGRRTTPTSSSISSTARSAPSPRAACPTGSGRRCRGSFPRRSTTAPTTAPSVSSTSAVADGTAARPADRHRAARG